MAHHLGRFTVAALLLQAALLSAAQPLPAPNRDDSLAVQDCTSRPHPPVVGGAVAATASGPAVTTCPTEPPPAPPAVAPPSRPAAAQAFSASVLGQAAAGCPATIEQRCNLPSEQQLSADPLLPPQPPSAAPGNRTAAAAAAAAALRWPVQTEATKLGDLPSAAAAAPSPASARPATTAAAASSRNHSAPASGPHISTQVRAAVVAVAQPLSRLTSARGAHKASVAAVAIWVLVLLLRHMSRHKYDMDQIPGPWKHALPLVGNLLQLLRPDFHRVLLRWADKYGGIVRVKFLWHDGLIVTDPAALAVICGRGEGALDKAAAIYSPINVMCGPRGHVNLLTSPADDSWRAVRKAIALSFAFSNIRKKFPLVRERTGELIEWLRRVGPSQAVDVDQAALRVTLDVIGLTAFGHDYGCTRLHAVPPNHLLRVLPRAFTEVMRRIANPLRGLAPSLFDKGPKGVQSFRDFQNHMWALLREMKARGPPARGDTDIGAQLYRVLEAAKQEAGKVNSGKRWKGPAITDERILSEIGILFVEGFETTGHTISWTLFNIATTPGVQEAVAEELASLGLLVRPAAEGGGGAARALELEDLKRLRYLTSCVKEAMRMFPVVSVMGRVTQRPTRVGPYLVPAGTPVGTPLFAIQNTVHNWREPHVYRPERWLGVPLETYVLDMRSREGITHDGTSPSPSLASSHAAAAAPAGPMDSPSPSSHPSSHPLKTPPTSLNGRHTSASTASTIAAGGGPALGGAGSPSGSMARGRSEVGSDEDGDGDDDGWGPGGADRRSGISFAPFSEGPRSCVGQSLAKLEVVTVLAMLLANFRIELAKEMGGREGIRKRESTHLTLQTAGLQGIRTHLHPRDQEPH